MSVASPQLVKSVKVLLQKDYPPAAVKKFLSKETGLKKTAARNLYNKIIGNLDNPQTNIKEIPADLELTDKYVYNEKTKKYIFFCKSVGKNIVLPKNQVDYIIKNYSSFLGKESSLNELSLKFNIPVPVLKEVLSCLNVTHSSLPISNEDLLNKSEEKIIEELLQDKKFALYQNLQKSDWQTTQSDAEKWVAFEMGQLNPFCSFLEKWKAPEYQPTKFVDNNKNKDKYLIISASDWHFGLFAQERYLYFKKEWNIEKTKEAVTKYALKIRDKVNDRKNGFKGAYLVFGGDILHSLSGFTDKGTKLEAYPISRES